MCDDIRKILAEQVQTAFATTQYPGDDNIVYDTTGRYSDIVETLDSFKSKHWRQLTPDVILLNSSHLAFFTAQAFCFYLPAYLLTIASYTGDTDQLLDTVFFYLTPPESGSQFRETFLRNFECFNTQQREAIKTLISLFICVMFGNNSQQVYQSFPGLMRAIAFWNYTETSL